MSFDLAQSFYTALSDDVTVVSYLGQFQEEPSIHTRVPVPESAEYPMIVVMPDASSTNFDALVSRRVAIEKDVIIYGEQDSDYRNVEELAYYIRDLFHRDRWTLTVAGYSVMSIEADGPTPAPTSDENHVARRVRLTVLLSKN